MNLPGATQTSATAPAIAPLDAPSRAGRVWRAWGGWGPRRASRLLVTAACALLFLHAAGTVELVYTVRASHMLLIAACAAGAPFVVRGWARLPEGLRWFAAALLTVYVLATIFGQTATLASEDRGSSYRSLVYLSDLGLGLAVVGLVAGLWTGGGDLCGVFRALFVGAALAGAYGIYQWFAQRFGLPLENLNNAVNSDGITRGGVSQGRGILGGERVRGTFVEPHFFAMFLASMLPIAGAFVRGPRRQKMVGLVGAALIVGALVLTTSAPAWAAFVLAGVTGLCLVAMSRGYVGLAAVGGATLAVALLLAGLTLADPGGLSSLTGRTANELATTTEFRTEIWTRVIDAWSTRPALGFGPGQGAVELAAPLPVPGRPVVLGTAEGLWAASLLDGGLLALTCWLLFLGATLQLGGRAVVRNGGPWVVAAFMAAAAAVVGSQVGGDRLDLRVWILLGVLATAAAGAAERDRSQSDGEAPQRAP